MQLVYDNVHGSGELYLKVMKAICGDVSNCSVLDLCCYHSPYIPQMGFKYRTYVDILDRKLDDENERQYFIQSDAFEFLERSYPNVWDWIVCSDGLEHFTSGDGMKLLDNIVEASWSRVLFTPLGENMVEKIPSNDPDTHKSGFTPDILENHALGYWHSVVFPKFHDTFGAFFFFHCQDNEAAIERIKQLEL